MKPGKPSLSVNTLRILQHGIRRQSSCFYRWQRVIFAEFLGRETWRSGNSESIVQGLSNRELLLMVIDFLQEDLGEGQSLVIYEGGKHLSTHQLADLWLSAEATILEFYRGRIRGRVEPLPSTRGSGRPVRLSVSPRMLPHLVAQRRFTYENLTRELLFPILKLWGKDYWKALGGLPIMAAGVFDIDGPIEFEPDRLFLLTWFPENLRQEYYKNAYPILDHESYVGRYPFGQHGDFHFEVIVVNLPPEGKPAIQKFLTGDPSLHINSRQSRGLALTKTEWVRLFINPDQKQLRQMRAQLRPQLEQECFNYRVTV